jgi:D-aspartate ligase
MMRRRPPGHGHYDPAEPSPAVVVGLDCVTGLQTSRTLHARGVPVIGLASDVRHFCCRTRTAREVLPMGPEEDQIADALARLGQRLPRPAVLFPCTDPAVRAIARHRSTLDSFFHIALASEETVQRLGDKIQFAKFAESLGLPVPRTHVLRDDDDLEHALAQLGFPTIVKPALRTPLWDRLSPSKVFVARSPAELRSLYTRSRHWTDALVVQEQIPGPDSELMACNAYFDRHGRLVASFVSQKLRQWPPQAGTGCLGRACRDPALVDLTNRLFSAAGFHGLGYLEVKRHPADGRYFLIEANPGRPTSRSALAEHVGVELLLTMYRDALGLPLPEALRQTDEPAAWIYLRQDLRAAYRSWRAGRLAPADWLRSLRDIRASAVFAWNDPGPSLADAAGIGLQLLTRQRRPQHSPAARPRTAVET